MIKNKIPPSYLFIRYLYITGNDIKEIFLDLFGLTIKDEDIERSTVGIPKNIEKTYHRSACKKYDCGFIYDIKKSLMKFTKNKKKMKFINTAIMRGVDDSFIVDVINSSFIEQEAMLLYTEEDLFNYRRCILNTVDSCYDSIVEFSENNQDMFVIDEEIDIAEIIFDAGLVFDGDFRKVMNEIAMISLLKARKFVRKDEEKSLTKAEKYMKIGSKAIDVKNKLDEIEKPASENKTEEFMIEFDKLGIVRPRTRKEILG